MLKDNSPVIKIVKKTLPAVISIIISKDAKEVQKELDQNLSQVPIMNPDQTKIPKEAIDANGMVKIGGGSGFVVNENGTILTNKHVIADPKAEYAIFTSNGEKYEAEVLARDPINDVAILKIKPQKPLPVLLLGDSTRVELGQSVLAFGNALGIFRNTVSSGIVSGLSRSIAAQADPTAPPQEMRGLIQTDAAINPGNSGGPLVDIFGKAIGINAALLFGAQNIGFAIPINHAKRDLEDLWHYGHIKRPLLGISYVTVDENLKAKMNLPVDYGALVTGEMHEHKNILEHDPTHRACARSGIVMDSPAHKAGIREKDIILECNGEKLGVEKTIQDFLEDLKVGDTLALKVMRGNKEFNAKVLLAERK
ncbi:MAG: trypsin-like peptidase domain-containing protein [Candidatus Liptonbacteria bacterium]|nr:trypsin-like peptidase domain-containing protein [Candidatus Liptonbacteria bacterium]